MRGLGSRVAESEVKSSIPTPIPGILKMPIPTPLSPPTPGILEKLTPTPTE